MIWGHYFNQTVSNELKYKLIINKCTPRDSCKFPIIGNENLQFQFNRFKRFPRLACTSERGALCTCCVLFARDYRLKGNHQRLAILFNKLK